MESLTEYTDAYLDFHRHSPEAYEMVLTVMHRWEWTIDLATDRAKEDLFVPDNVIQVDFRPKA